MLISAEQDGTFRVKPVAVRSPAAQQTLSDSRASAELFCHPSSSQPAALDAHTTVVDEITEAYAADSFFANTAGMTHAEGLWWEEGCIVLPDSKKTKLLILQAMCNHPLAAQQRHTHYHDAKHAPAVFATDDEMLLSTSGLQLRISGTDKLAPKFIGPFEDLERIGGVSHALASQQG
ncbi:MAG: hypothetical protein FRX49_11483 [Trebouxia sp. A1-2]|nr:MAG: hypothetical protein FRX49_11483 [Trebouxia sp. A1-2]